MEVIAIEKKTYEAMMERFRIRFPPRSMPSVGNRMRREWANGWTTKMSAKS